MNSKCLSSSIPNFVLCVSKMSLRPSRYRSCNLSISSMLGSEIASMWIGFPTEKKMI